VKRDSYAWREGLRADDIVLGINRRRIDTLSQLGEVVPHNHSRRRALVMQIQRGRYSYLVTLE